MMKGILGVIGLLVAIVVIAAYTSVFFITPTQQALVLRLGEPIRSLNDGDKQESGLHFKTPLIDTVVYLDKRILDLDNAAQEVIAADQKRLVVDAFARYKITDPLRFFQSVNNTDRANSQLSNILNSSMRRVLGESSFIQVVRDERAGLMSRIRELVNREAASFGISVVDVRIRRADLPDANSQAVFQRMQTERQREAAEIRAGGSQLAQTIRARADRDVTVLLAEATSKSEQIRGEGDGKRNAIFAAAFTRDPDFFSFYRSMQAYEAGLKQGETRMLISPDSDFFRYFNDAGGRFESAPRR